MRWVALEIEKILSHFNTNLKQGLSKDTAKLSLNKFGSNTLDEKSKQSYISLFIDQFKNLMLVILVAAMLISAILGEYIDALAVLAIILINAVLGFIQEARAEQSLSSLKKLSSPVSLVLRDGSWSKIDASLLVPGDIVKVVSGDRIPADLRLFDVNNLYTDESSLTGESHPVSKSTAALSTENTAIGDRVNMCFMGTMAVKGTGIGIVTETGMSTEMGKIASMLQTTEKVTTPLQHRLEQLGQVLIIIALALTALTVFTGVWHGQPFHKMFLTGVSLAVAAIPEGMPAIVTIALAIGVQRMIKKRAIVRKLPSVETLGCATVICSDKTGTLTQNKMTVTNVWFDKQESLISQNNPKSTQSWDQMCKIALYCNNAIILENDKIEGDPTEAALLVMASASSCKRDSNIQIKREISFDSDRKMMSVVTRDSSTKRLALYAKGAPDVLLDKCTHILFRNRKEPLTNALRNEIMRANECLANQSLRNIGFAYRELPQYSIDEPDRQLEQSLTFVGIAGIIDPLRSEVKEAILSCRNAGIRTIMITGDHSMTALAIAKELQIADKINVLTGAELASMTSKEILEQVEHTNVYARVSPEHKLKVVKALQEKGHVVAMTGDGVNDAPAIKAADIGIAMGVMGTDVSKESAAVVLADDNFKTIVSAIREGRAIYDNIRKFISYLLASNVGEILLMFLTMLAGLPLPLLPTQILWINLVTDGLPAMALAVDPAETDTMSQRPRNKQESVFAHGIGWKIVTRGFLIGFCSLLAFMIAYTESSHDLALAQTVAFATLVMAQLIYVFDCRSVGTIFQRTPFDNIPLLLAVLSSVILLVCAIYQPSLHYVFHTVPLGVREWILISITSSLPVLLAGLLDQATRRNA